MRGVGGGREGGSPEEIEQIYLRPARERLLFFLYIFFSLSSGAQPLDKWPITVRGGRGGVYARPGGRAGGANPLDGKHETTGDA